MYQQNGRWRFQIVFEKDRCKTVRGEMVLMRGVCCGNLYNLLGRTVIDACKNSIVLVSKHEEGKVPNVFGGDTVLWHQRLRHIEEKGLQSLQGKGMVGGMSNCNLYFNFCEHYLYGK